MASFDRDAALKNAEKALRLGRIDAAIAEYVRIVDAQPRDWNSANTLGDLYVRANKIDAGVAQFQRIAEHLARDGFFPKAAALYKKILKVRPGDENALLQSGDIAAEQGLLADAKSAYKLVAEKRRSRGDKKGAAEVDIRLGKLDPDDLSSRLAAAHAACEIGQTDLALAEFRDVATRLDKQQKRAEALEVLTHVARLAPGDLQVRTTLAHGFAAAGDLPRARHYLDAQTAGENATLWLTLGEIELRAGKHDVGRAAVRHALALDPSLTPAARDLGCALAAQSDEGGYQCIDAVVEVATAKGAYSDAAAGLSAFVAVAQHHLIALMRLVEVCVDGGLEGPMSDAQAQLADAYLEVGRGLEARIISEDLLARDPSSTRHLERFKRALLLLGETDPEAVIAQHLSADSPFLASSDLDLNDESFDVGAGGQASGADGDSQTRREPQSETVVVTPRSLDHVFRDMQAETTEAPDEEAAAEQHALGITYLDLGMTDEAIDAFKEAARSPRQRFDAAARVGRLYAERGELASAVQWFERAAEVPPASSDAGHHLLYDLAETLERAGESERALAVLVELSGDCPGFRDVASRIERLSTPVARLSAR